MMSFLNYTGEVQNVNYLYHFKYKNAVKESSYTSFNVADPTIDNNFKKIFSNEKLLLNFLNEILFPESKEIVKVQYTKTEFPGISGRHSIGSKRIDVGCKCFCKNPLNQNFMNEEDEIPSKILIEEGSSNISEAKNEAEEEENAILIDLEMQIGYSEKNTERFMKYISHIDSNIISKKKIWIVALTLRKAKYPEKDKSSIICYEKKSLQDCISLKAYDDYLIIDIDLNYCLKMIWGGTPFWIINEKNKINENGIEWIKLLTLPIWCSSLKEGFYILPNIDKKNFFINKNIKEAILILSNPGPFYGTYIIDEREYRKQIEERELKERKYEELIKNLQETIKANSLKYEAIIEQLNTQIKSQTETIKNLSMFLQNKYRDENKKSNNDSEENKSEESKNK